MRGRVFDVQRFSVHDGPGIRTTVFLSGCSLRCAWCHNPESFDAASGQLRTAEEVLAEVLEDRDYYATSGGGLTVSGGEPMLQRDFVRALLSLAKREGLHTCVQTAGHVPFSSFLEVLEVVDLFQFDLKHLDPAKHLALTGAGSTQLQQNAAQLVERGAKVEFRVPVVPGFNDDAENHERVAAFLAGHGATSVRLVPYQRMYLEKYVRLGLVARCAGVESPSAALLETVSRRFRARGLTVSCDA
jgi:pyruvate formate lyase activating enzyme